MFAVVSPKACSPGEPAVCTTASLIFTSLPALKLIVFDKEGLASTKVTF